MIHPETWPDVYKELIRIHTKHPDLSYSHCQELACKLVKTLCEANTKLFYSENMSIK